MGTGLMDAVIDMLRSNVGVVFTFVNTKTLRRGAPTRGFTA